MLWHYYIIITRYNIFWLSVNNNLKKYSMIYVPRYYTHTAIQYYNIHLDIRKHLILLYEWTRHASILHTTGKKHYCSDVRSGVRWFLLFLHFSFYCSVYIIRGWSRAANSCCCKLRYILKIRNISCQQIRWYAKRCNLALWNNIASLSSYIYYHRDIRRYSRIHEYRWVPPIIIRT